jgi:hypothetical protein
VVFLYDCDTKKPDETVGQLYVRCIPHNSQNARATKGIENLLPEAALTENMYEERRTPKGDGGHHIEYALNKMALCKFLCETKRAASDFAKFGVVLDLIEKATTK